MKESIKRYVRTAQTFFPWLTELKADVQLQAAQLTKHSFEADFDALRLFGGTQRLHLDIGANRGQSIIAICQNAYSPWVISFEPNPRLAAALARRFDRVPNVRVEPVGLGDCDGVFELFIPAYRGYVFDGLASFVREEAMSWLNPRTIVNFDPAKLSCDTVRCHVTTLDSFGLAPFFAKLDVQGYELPALIGAEKTIRQHTPVLLVEAPSPDLVSYLLQLGYRSYGFHSRERRFHAGLGGRNVFFLTDDKAELVSRFIA